jgi:hypothetical protein
MPMKITISVLFICLMFLGCTKDCNEWYAGVTLRGVSKNPNNNQSINDWYETDYLVNELSFWIVYPYSSDGYEGCKSKTRIHELERSAIKIFCSGRVVIGTDTLSSNTNLFEYFSLLTQRECNDIMQYNSTAYPFPKFETSINNFKIEVPLSDGKVLQGTKIISVN